MVEVAAGEVIDKITILQIKSERITDTGKLANVRTELDLLSAVWARHVATTDALAALIVDLKRVNEALWEIEDNIRAQERASDFGARFIQLARAVYKTNDRRAALKREINTLLGSKLVEEKFYAAY
jgi:hypothetical protein